MTHSNGPVDRTEDHRAKIVELSGATKSLPDLDVDKETGRKRAAKTSTSGKDVVRTQTTPIVPIIDPNGVYTMATARMTLGLRENCLPREARLGRLRVSKRAGRHFVLGKWLLQWLESGEVCRTRTTHEECRREE
jgi:hypothetical protein